MLEKWFVELAEAAGEKKIKIEEGILTRRIDSARSPSPRIDISDDIIANPKSYSSYT